LGINPPFGFCGCRAEEGSQALGQSLGQARAQHEIEVTQARAWGQFGGRQPVARGELGVAKSLRGRKLARLRQASGPHWAASTNEVGRPAGPLGLSWATWEWGRLKRLAGPGSASS
jgi:hypothetical protein